ncbi:TlpA family protein disulfide reductase [Rhizomonospora bruguierae]|uniref:TlpA family protein disulfide reductase n=1 Tax=Rhizomonospora bruguierae TaxID=1581705 RepID=UPI001BCC6295|nr:TlpA disulfide reductase family protein [Micromonospora sp. NBRC 107566]
MTDALFVAVLFLAALTLFNLIVVLGVVRRLRSYETRLGAVAEPPLVSTMAAGEQVGDFTASTVDDRVVSRASLGGPTLVGFFSPNCPACHERLGDFRAAADGHPGDVLAVVVRDGGDVAPVLSALAGTDVVIEEPEGPLARAFGVRGFPAFIAVREEGVVESVGFQVPVPA